MKQRKRYSGEQKAIILRELLENNVPISELSEKYSVRPNDIYNWKKKLFESASGIFGQQVSTT
ncbi:MAG: transposase, partial [Saprospiraceae bacterium]|nr:transposase [Saprospiraceae bacterium]